MPYPYPSLDQYDPSDGNLQQDYRNFKFQQQQPQQQQQQQQQEHPFVFQRVVVRQEVVSRVISVQQPQQVGL
jgi:hypothetical protein